MTKNDLKLICACIDKNNPKPELNYALVTRDGFYATDTRKAIHFNVPMLECNEILIHKNILNGFASLVTKDDEVAIDGFGYLHCGITKMSCDTFDNNDLKFTNVKKILDQKLDYWFKLKSIDDLHFELTQKECYVDDFRINPFIELSNCNSYLISFNKQKIEDGVTNTGMVKIVGLYNTDDETDLIKFTAIIMGREFKTQAKEQLLLDI